MTEQPRSDGETCTCGTPGLDYEGPQEDCEIHGQYRSVLIAERSNLRAQVAALTAERDRLATDRDSWRRTCEKITGERDAALRVISEVELICREPRLLGGGSRTIVKAREAVRAALAAVSGTGQPEPQRETGALQREAIAARARGDFAAERAALDSLALAERAAAPVVAVPGQPREDEQRQYACAECGGKVTTADDLITINVSGHAKAAHRVCPVVGPSSVTGTTP